MKFVPFLFLILHLSEARVASSETSVGAIVTSEVKERPPLHYPCVFRSLPGDPYPSVIVRWQDQLQMFTWNSEGRARYKMNYKYPAVQQSHSYPSGGLSGDGGAGTTAKPFSDVPVVPEYYVFDDIVQWFNKDCVRP